MKIFNVIIWDPNYKKFISYDIVPYFVDTYKDLKERKYKKIPKTFDEFKKWVIEEARYQFWGRCEYEVILVDWPCQQKEEKIDVYWQIMMNIELITQLVIDSIQNSVA